MITVADSLIPSCSFILFMMILSSYAVSGNSTVILKNFHTIITSNSNNNNLSLPFVIDNCTMESKLGGFEVDMHFHMPHYESFMPHNDSYDSVIEHIVETIPLLNKIEITFMTDEILVVPIVKYQLHGYYHIQALLVEDGIYKMYVRLECGSIDYMTIKRDAKINKMTTAFYLESRRIVNNFEIPIINNDSFRMNESINNNYCSSTQAFQGRFHIDSSFNYYDANQHDGDVDFTFQPYGCKLRDTSNSTELLGLLSNQHIIFLGDSTLEQVYRGILERMYGPNTFIDENNSPEWKNILSKFNILPHKTHLLKRWFDFDKSDNNIRLSFMFNGCPAVLNNARGAVSEDFTTSYDWKLYRTELHRIISESINQCRPITFLFNSGLHDIASKKGNDLLENSLYQTNLKKSMQYLQSTVSELQSKRSSDITCPDSSKESSLSLSSSSSSSSYFWVSIVPPVERMICVGGMVRQLNEIASHVANKHGFKVLDAHSLLTGTLY